MTEIIVDYFDLEQICESGQCFRMKRKSEHQYEVIAGDRYLQISQKEIKFVLTVHRKSMKDSGSGILIWKRIMEISFRELILGILI